MIEQWAPAKINLFLHVGMRRDDGFHPLQSLAVFTQGPAVSDRLAFAPADDVSLALDGPFAAALAGDGGNLVLDAAKLLRTRFGAKGGAAITLTKNLPVASGIGGGSADAAAALRGLRDLWKLPVDDAALRDGGATLGSDVPVCIAATAAFMEGRGESLIPVLTMPRLAMLLVNPGVAVSTRAVFAALQTRRGTQMALPDGGFADTGDLLRFLEATGNDLEAPARALQPVIGAVLDAITANAGALLTRMSGSGATCFGIFANADCCERAARALGAAHPDWWVAAGRVAEFGQVAEQTGQDIGPTPEGL